LASTFLFGNPLVIWRLGDAKDCKAELCSCDDGFFHGASRLRLKLYASCRTRPQYGGIRLRGSQRWNAQHALAEAVVLLPVKWENPSAPIHPQGNARSYSDSRRKEAPKKNNIPRSAKPWLHEIQCKGLFLCSLHLVLCAGSAVRRSRRPQARLETSCTRTGRPRRHLRPNQAAGRWAKATAARLACTSPRSHTTVYR